MTLRLVFYLFSLLLAAPGFVYGKGPAGVLEINANGTITNVDVATFKTKLKETTGYQLIDVRTPEEYQAGHLKGAKLINFYASDFESRLQNLDKNKPVMIYCKSGNRSGQAAAKMKQLGFKVIYNMNGGINAWKSAGYPVE